MGTWLPSFSDFTGDYLLNIDAGLRATIWRGLFTDFQLEFRYDNEPAPGRRKCRHAFHPGGSSEGPVAEGGRRIAGGAGLPPGCR
jgi:hypothetical protein